MRWLVVLVLLLTASVVAGPSASADVTLPPTGTDLDYQLGGNAPWPAHVGIVVRDREAAPAASAYSVCYVNGFQTQPHEKRFWRRHWGLVLKRDGRPVVDAAWGEWLLDLRTPHKRRALARIMGRWAAGCAGAGYQAVEFDNLDSFTRSRGLISPRHTRAYAALLVRRSHRHDLAVAQKNRAGWDGTRVGFDFAIAEECGRWRECASYVDDFGEQVLVVEYRRKDFRWTCRHHGDSLPVVLRDRALSRTGVRAWC
jgi:hypothetical protein